MKHWIKALDPDSPTNVLTFARGLNGPIATELAPDGSLLVLNRATIWRDSKKFVADAGSFVRIRYVGSNTRPTDPVRNSFVVALGLPSDAAQLPRTLTRADWQNTLRDAKGSPFWMNAQAWQPFAEERIKLYLPPVASVKTELPSGAVVAREFAIGDRPIETRLLVIGTPRGYGASYRWITPERAQLVEDGELETTLPWWFPGVDDGLTWPITNPAYWVPAIPATSDLAVNWRSPRESSDARVRSYLHGNCAVCHQPGGASRGFFDARITTPLSGAGIINGAVVAGDLGIPGAKIVVPGQPEKSILYRRLKATDFFRMPPVQYHNEPSPILPVLEEWIRSL